MQSCVSSHLQPSWRGSRQCCISIKSSDEKSPGGHELLISPSSEHFICPPADPGNGHFTPVLHRAHPSSRPSLCECEPPAGPANRRISWSGGVVTPLSHVGARSEVWCTLPMPGPFVSRPPVRRLSPLSMDNVTTATLMAGLFKILTSA